VFEVATQAGLSIAVRLAAAAGRSTEADGSRDAAARVLFELSSWLGWLLACSAAWLAVGAAGACTPWWPAAVVAVTGSAAEAVVKRARRGSIGLRLLRAAADGVVVLAGGLLSIPPLAPWKLVALAVAVPAVGALIDLWPRTLARPWRPAVVFAPIIAAVLGTLGSGSGRSLLSGSFGRPNPLLVGLAPPLGGEPVVLGNGATGWFNRPAQPAPRVAAVLFHGADPTGAMQPAATVLRRALVEAGYLVLAVDHLGYGSTPAPPADAPVEAWDPLPLDLAAVHYVQTQPGIVRVLLVGHSMGCNDVWRLLANGAPVAEGVVFGAALPDPAEKFSYWYGRFHRDRRLASRLPEEKVRSIREQYYDGGALAARVAASGPRVIFVCFGIEHPNIAATRDRLYAMLPGEKAVWDLPGVTHYFTSYHLAQLVLGDTSTTRRLASHLRELRLDLERQTVNPTSAPALPTGTAMSE